MRTGKLISGILVLFLSLHAAAQEIEPGDPDTLVVTKTVIDNGDTIPNVTLGEVIILPKVEFKNRFQAWRYRKLVRDLKKVYPYAQLAKQKLDKMEKEFLELETEKERKKYVKTIEDQLMDEFGNELKKLTITQGRLLLKLIDRETGSTSYVLLQELRGNFSAVFWQAVARLFGSNLKSEYDPSGEDRMIERIVLLIEHHQI
ncbi:MAG: DUF4294 domain-containing protein [Bacteroidales bacterium]|jgi:hypothetical protein|nr:DUF4294 domain-containing protein [Bacteroidales bacterium]